jgi:hypothetical protein
MQWVYSNNANAAGVAVVTANDVAAGMQRVIAQWSNETAVFRVGSTCTVRRDGRFVTNSSLGSGDTAFGPPALLMSPTTVMTFTFAGLVSGDEAIVTLFGTETTFNTAPDPNVVV